MLEESVNNVNFELLDGLDNYTSRIWQDEKLVREAFLEKLNAGTAESEALPVK